MDVAVNHDVGRASFGRNNAEALHVSRSRGRTGACGSPPSTATANYGENEAERGEMPETCEKRSNVHGGI